MDIFPEELATENSMKRRRHLLDAIQVVVQKYIHLSIVSEDDVDLQSDDHVLAYKCDVLLLDRCTWSSLMLLKRDVGGVF